MKRLHTNWQASILVCRKCSKRLGGGFGPKGKQSLAKLLRRQADGGKRRKAAIGIIEVKCLGVCPRNAVTVIDGRRPDSWLIVPAGSDVAVVVEALSYGKGDNESPREN